MEIGMFPDRVEVNGVIVPGTPMLYAEGRVKIITTSQTMVGLFYLTIDGSK